MDRYQSIEAAMDAAHEAADADGRTRYVAASGRGYLVRGTVPQSGGYYAVAPWGFTEHSPAGMVLACVGYT